MKLLQVGCGKMGGAMLHRWAQTTSHSFTVVDPTATSLPNSVEHRTFEALGDSTFDALIVGIKPQLIDTILPDYQKHVSPQGWVYSMAAGASCERLSKCLSTPAVVRIMPNLPALIGQSMSGLFATPAVTAPQKEVAQALAGAIGQWIWVKDEDTIDRVTAVAGSGPGYVFELIRCYIEAAQQLGFEPDAARELVLQTVLGAAQMALKSEQSLEALRESVTSKNGTTQAGLEKLRDQKRLEGLLRDTIQAAYARAVELR